ncbi:hypothetical protein DAPPUDRAFT_312315 [Daphnia pulex]|uniref:Metalloendopeptidase n=1 Tax=Daphnia pulex TaxID=6669 RepID=E9G0F9_DAPPU|nr:hypothetical protein DAPPUDRAFT_312315 [Daphnia pulex]|eukprot:EFX86900.1 hypothetical protein DAPPUDRAFT_312315 [Daphnia pulex]
MNEFHKRTCIRFLPRTSEDGYIQITRSVHGCKSAIGRKGGPQTVNLGDRCTESELPGFAIHELMHTIGFEHEHQRPDRDNYVSINWDNIKPEHRFEFIKKSAGQVNTLGLPYDYGSVMHYPKVVFAIDRHVPVITALKGNPSELGQRAGFSALDVKKMNKLYKCVLPFMSPW